MGIKRKKRFQSRFDGSNKMKNSNCLYVNEVSFSDLFETYESKDMALNKDILLTIVMVGLAVMTMTQICISAKPETIGYTDKLPSYKDMKRRFISSELGRRVASFAGIVKALPYALQQEKSLLEKEDEISIKLFTIAMDMSQSNTNAKRVSPGSTNWQIYAKGEMTASLGQLLSCPCTNVDVLNIKGNEIYNFGLAEALVNIGFNPDVYHKYGLSIEGIKNEVRKQYLTDNGGLPTDKITYNEPKNIYSRIQEDILGDSIIRNGSFSTVLVKGVEPDVRITKKDIDIHLNKYEKLAYDFAKKSGDKNILKKYTDLIVGRAKGDKIKGYEETQDGLVID